jgi:molybdenum cofactor biosynthesis protein MoaC
MVDLPTERYEKPAPELPPVAEQTPAFLGPELTPLVFSEAKHIQTTDLRSNLPIEGSQVIDNELHINFDAAVPDLQSQLYNLQYRLQNAYPRIDTLPYDVWTSTNKKTLKMWLKILAGKWETRFENIEYNVDDDLATVLDQMVQEHELSNEAARRMAQKFDMVFAKRGSMHGDSEGTLNLDEFEAEWGSWLRDDHAEDASDQVGEGSAVGVEAEGSEGGELKSGNANTNTNAGKPSHGLLGSLPFSWSAKPETGYRRADSPVRHFSTSALSRSAPKKEDTLPVAHSKAQNSPSTSPSASLSALPHLTPTGSAHMVSVSRKPSTLRTAIAIGRVRFSNATPLSLIKSNALKKGDVLSVARIAGITAAKKTPDLVPLCHPIMLEHVGVSVTVMNPQEGNGVFDFGGIHIQAKVQCTGPTGVEMEALSAVMGAALTVVDMCKAVDRGMGIEGVRVVLKEGGRSGTWREEGWEEKAIED